MSIQNLLDRWETHADISKFSLTPIYTNLMFQEQGVSKTLEQYGISTDDLLAAGEDTQKQLMPHLTAIDEALVQATKSIEGFILATLYDDAEGDDEEVIALFRDMRESVYDEYRSIKDSLDLVGEIV
jgi:hypothetical protein